MLYSSPHGHSRLMLWVSAVLLALIVVVGALSLTHLISLVRSASPQIDFGVYYLSGSILESSDPNDLFSIARLEKEATARGLTSYGTEFQGMHYDYPPFLAVLMRPVSRLPYSVAQTGWLAFNSLAILLSVPPLVVWSKERRPSVGGYLAILLLAVLYTPAHSAVVLGQVSPLMLLSLSWAFGLLSNRTVASQRISPVIAGWLIGFATMIKLFPVVLVVLLLWKRQWRVAAWAIVSLAGYTLIGILGGGLSNTAQFFTSFLPSFYGERVYHSLFYNQSFSAALVRWLGPSPLVPSLSLLYTGAILGITSIAVVRSRGVGSHHSRLAVEFGLVLVASILVLTYLTLNYYVLLPVAMSALWFSPGIGARHRLFSVLGSMAFICIYVISAAVLALWNIGYIVPFGLIAVLLLWGGLVVHVGCESRPLASEAQP